MRLLPVVLFALLIQACTQPITRLELPENCTLQEENTNLPDHVRALNGSALGFINLAAPDQEFEYHIISSYEGSGTISVEPTEKPVVLLIDAYEAGVWTIETDEDSKLANVIITSSKKQNLQTDLEEEYTHYCRSFFTFEHWIQFNGDTRFMPEDAQRSFDQAQALTGLSINSYQEFYNPGFEFTVPPRESDFNSTTEMVRASKPVVLKEVDEAELLADYERIIAGYPIELKSTANIMIKAMKDGGLPVRRISRRNGISSRNAPLDLQPYFTNAGTKIKRSDLQNCHSSEHMIGNNERNQVDCSHGDNFIVTLGGRDKINDSWGNDIINGGPDADIIDTGWGHDIVIFEKNWGDDVLHTTCHYSQVAPEERQRIAWPSKFGNIVLFGPGLDPRDLYRSSENVIKSKSSDDRLTISDSCFSFIFTDHDIVWDDLKDIPLVDD